MIRELAKAQVKTTLAWFGLTYKYGYSTRYDKLKNCRKHRKQHKLNLDPIKAGRRYEFCERCGWSHTLRGKKLAEARRTVGMS